MSQNKKIKILLIIDVHQRDLKECCLLGYHLARRGCEVFFSSTKNEVSEMLRRRPHVIVLSHLQYKRFHEVVRTAKQMGVKICIMPPEGIPAFKEAVAEIYGDSNLVSSIDLFLSWGPEVTECIKKQILSARIETVGCPRFDTYHERFLPLFRNKESFYAAYGFDPRLPLVTWISSGGYHKREVQDVLDHTHRISELGKRAWNRERIESQRLTFQSIKDFLSRYLKKYPGTINLAFRPHPLEEFDASEYFKKEHPDFRIIDSKDPLEETLFYTRVYVGFPCTAAIESWVQDPRRMCLFVRHPDFKGELEFQNQILQLSEVASFYEDFESMLNQCLQNSVISDQKVKARKEVVFRYLYEVDGKSGERCAEAIQKLGQESVRPNYSIHQILPLMQLVKNRVISGHWLGIKRLPEHHKYFPPSKIEDWLSKFSPLYTQPSGKLKYHLDF